MHPVAWLLHPSRETEHGWAGLALLVLGEMMILIRIRPLSDFYFPVVWLGFVLLLDAALYAQTGRSPFVTCRRVFLATFVLSSVFWWIFELFNVVVHNWVYVGGSQYSGFGYIAVASVDFAMVLPAVWEAALFVVALLPEAGTGNLRSREVPSAILILEFVGGLVCLVAPILLPRYTYGLIWGSTCLLLDPINAALGRPSIIEAVLTRRWRLPISFALGALMCGFFWEAWNYWSMPKWVYDIPYVGFLPIFEMPLLGWLGYLPFGLELFAMANFLLPVLRLSTLTLEIPDCSPDGLRAEQSLAS